MLVHSAYSACKWRVPPYITSTAATTASRGEPTTSTTPAIASSTTTSSKSRHYSQKRASFVTPKAMQNQWAVGGALQRFSSREDPH